ncbi:hypothetical protein HMPREF0202_02406, partial [Cetobacterium somerae ATCC BAA-474]
IKNISSKYEIKKMIMTIGLEDFKNILKIENLRDDISLIKEKFNEIIMNNEPIFLKELAISGKDILNLGIKDGKKIKELLEKSLDIVLKNPELNQKNYLLKLIEEEKI